MIVFLKIINLEIPLYSMYKLNKKRNFKASEVPVTGVTCR